MFFFVIGIIILELLILLELHKKFIRLHDHICSSLGVSFPFPFPCFSSFPLSALSSSPSLPSSVVFRTIARALGWLTSRISRGHPGEQSHHRMQCRQGRRPASPVGFPHPLRCPGSRCPLSSQGLSAAPRQRQPKPLKVRWLSANKERLQRGIQWYTEKQRERLRYKEKQRYASVQREIKRCFGSKRNKEMFRFKEK